jgi:hypothetical protein
VWCRVRVLVGRIYSLVGRIYSYCRVNRWGNSLRERMDLFINHVEMMER